MLTHTDTEPDAARCALVAEALEQAGSLRLVARGASMLPAIWPGEELEIHRAPANRLSPGDIAVCLVAGRIRIHRVRQVLPEYIVTQGDSLTRPDPPVPFSQVRGRVVYIRRPGARRAVANRVRVGARAASYLLARSWLLGALAVRLRRWLGAWPAPLKVSHLG
jgi:hypothetical protein